MPTQTCRSIPLPIQDARNQARHITTSAGTLRDVLELLQAKTEQPSTHAELVRLVQATVVVSREALAAITDMADGVQRELDALAGVAR